MRKKVVVSVLVALVLVTGVTATVTSAQEANNQSENGNDETVYDYHMGETLRVVDYEFTDGTFNATFESDGRSSVIITQTSNKEGIVTLNRERVVLQDGRTNVEFETGGSNAVTVDADQLYKITAKDSGFFISLDRTYTAGESIILAVIGGVVGVIMVMVVAFRTKLNNVTKTEKIV